MKWLENMNNAIEYIEENLNNKMDYEKISRVAYCSTYHFQRTFTFMTNITLSEYVRRRKMTEAALELKNSKVKVIDLALNYGYESPEAFSRAFKSMHGVSPTIARRAEVNVKSYPRISFRITIKGDVEMNYRIEEKEEFEVFGVSTEINNIGEKPYIEIPQFWKKCIEDGTIEKLRMDSGVSEETQVHSTLYNRREDKFSYMICYHMPDKEIPSDYKRLTVPSGTWAIFTTGVCNDGECDIQSIWKRMSEWFANSSYEIVEGPEFEMTYYRGNNKYEQEVWIPVKKRD